MSNVNQYRNHNTLVAENFERVYGIDTNGNRKGNQQMNVQVKKLIQAMALKKLNQNQLAKRSGVSRNTINGMLKGKKTTNIDTLGKIATALEISPLELIETDN